MDRRQLMTWGAVLLASGWPLRGRAQIEPSDDGLYKQPFFLDSFLELGDDLQQAASEGKGLVVLFEQRGCPYCREMHLVNFARPEITDYLQAHFQVVQLDRFWILTAKSLRNATLRASGTSISRRRR